MKNIRIVPVALFLMLIAFVAVSLLLIIPSLEEKRRARIPQPEWVSLRDELYALQAPDSLAIQADSLAVDRYLAAIDGYERLVLTYADSVLKSPIAFAEIALQCARIRAENYLGDPFRFLLIAQNTVVDNFDSLHTFTIVHELADEYAQNALYRRAAELLDLIPVSYQVAERDTLEADLELLIERSEDYRSNSSIPLPAPDSRTERIAGRILDMLTVALENSWYDELSYARAGYPTLRYAQLNGVNSALSYPFYESDQRVFGRSDDEDEWLGDELVPFDLPDSTETRLYRFVRQLNANQDSVNAFLNAHAAVRDIKTLIPSMDDFFSPEEEIPIYDVLLDGQEAALAFWVGFDQWLIVLFAERPDGTVSVSKQVRGGLELFQLRDMTGDGRNELVITDRQGSGGFFSIDLIDLASQDFIWRETSLYHGSAAFMDMDMDPAEEIVLHYAMGDRVVECNQCPSLYNALLFDYDEEAGTYGFVAERPTSAEMLLDTHGNLAGLSPSMYRSAMFSAEMLGPKSTNDWFTEMEQTPVEAWPDTLVDHVFSIYELELELLNEMTSFSTAANLSSRLIDVLSRDSLSDRSNFYRLLAFEEKLYALFQAGEAEKAIEVGQIEAYKAAVDTFDVMARNYGNMMGLSHLLMGEYSTAYPYLKLAEESSGELEEAILGNFALYFRSIDDDVNTYNYALDALDLAYSKGNVVGQAIDMIYLASATTGNNTGEERLDWLIRSLKLSRSFPSGGQAALAFQAGAEIAIEEHLPGYAISLLDEAIAIMDAGTWQTEGPGMMYLYGKAFALQGEDDFARKLYRIAMKLGEKGSSVTYVNASYELSRMYSAENDLDNALLYARLAFEATGSRRKSIGVESHKFAFLASKRTIAAWYIQLLMEMRSTPEELLDVVEAWKMQAFIDTYDHKNIFRQNLEDAGADLSARLGAMLGSNELFLNFVLVDPIPFVLSVSDQGVTDLVPLSVGPDSLKALVQRVRSFMDIRNPAALNHIRRNEMPEALRDLLENLHAALIAPLGIGPQIERLLIASDEQIFGLPWSALIDGDARYLIDRYDVTQVPSGRLAYTMGRRYEERAPRIEKKALIVAALGAVSNEELISSLPSLAATHPNVSLSQLNSGWDEAETVANALSTSRYEIQYLADEDTRNGERLDGAVLPATPGRFLKASAGAGIIHVVAHGVFNPFDPMQSSIFLDEGGNGRSLTANDLIELNLENAELVTLSACQTGMSDAMPGAEPVGFIRALIGAGAHNVILTEWEVDDRATSEIFSSMYAGIDDENKVSLLRDAQQKVRASHEHPYYWAGITLYGPGK